MEEISADCINELETQLYSTLHYNYAYNPKPEEDKKELVTFSKNEVQRYWKNPASVYRTLLHSAKEKTTDESNLIASENIRIIASNQQFNDKLKRKNLQSEKCRKENEFSNKFNKNQKLISSQKNSSNQRFPRKNDPLTQKIKKLSKITLLREKKKKAQGAQKRSGQTTISTIIIDSSCDEDGNTDDVDVILIPTPPPITINIDASDDEHNSTFNNIPLNSSGNAHENNRTFVIDENAVSSPIINTNSSFVLPQTVAEDSIRFGGTSRCTSPCSVSTDDFIGVHDRTRLNHSKNLGADDEDLRDVLGEEAKSQILTQSFVGCNQKNKNCKAYNMKDERSKTTNLLVDKEKCAVEQEDVCSLEEYENEKNLAKGVYSKKKFNSNPTIIRSLSSSSDDINDEIENRSKLNEANKLNHNYIVCNIENRKRSNSTGVAFISRGIAVERCSSLSQTPLNRRTSLSNCSSSHMSDHEFISTLNNLAQGDNKNMDESEKDSEDENAPSARDIVEKVINSHGLLSDTTALPELIIENMDDIFHNIDKIDSSVEKSRRSPDFTSVISDSADSNDSFNDCLKSNNKKNVNSHNQTLPMFNLLDKNLVSMETNTHSTTIIKKVDPVYNVVYNRLCNFNGGIGWDEEMRRFYNDNWNGNSFNIKEIWKGLDPNKKLWKIYTDDRFPKERRNPNLKCSNCCEFGHTRAKCKRPKKSSICFMCGECGHYEPRCPNTLCLRCGRKTRVFTKSCNSCTYHNRLICPVCKIRGHSLNLCPDKWRRYHSTIEQNAHPNNNIKYNTKKCCCICGRRGHLSETCKSAVRFMEYPIIVSDIKSHKKTYSDQAITSQDMGIAYNLLYKPQKEYFFDLANNTMKDKCYGRFLKSVGMEYMLKRKRRLSNINTEALGIDDATKSKRIALSHSVEVQTPVKSKPLRTLSTAPEQVQEISKSGITDVEENTTTKHLSDISVGHINNKLNNKIMVNADNIVINNETIDREPNSVIHVNHAISHETENKVEFKTPSKTQFHINIGSSERGDSDSNYSFSEHFDGPNYNHQYIASRNVEPLPDYIPFFENGQSSSRPEVLTDITTSISGISHCFVSSDDEREKVLPSLPEMPCEAKIYLTNFHSKFLLSPSGNSFLVEQSKQYDIKARLDFSSVGHVLVLFGLPKNQDHFHQALLHKYCEIKDQLNYKRNTDNSQKVPKRVDVLIRFLRENITQLFNNLGNVNDLLKKLQVTEQQQSLSKAGFKSVEKLRRSLNMILLGQAGLLNGDHHINKLLISLKVLIDDFNGEDHAPIELRNDIDSHWRVIFTPYRHGNYPKMVDTYNRLLVKNHILKLKIDPYLLGQKVINMALSSEQNEDLKKPITSKPIRSSDKKCTGTITNSVIPSPPPSVPSMKIQQFTTDNTTPNKYVHNITAKPSLKKQFEHKSTIATSRNCKSWECNVGNIFTQIDGINSKDKNIPKAKTNVSKGPSMFWSRESIRYLDECINLAECNLHLLQKLQRIQMKSYAGQLSYNDYRAVIRLHSAMLGK